MAGSQRTLQAEGRAGAQHGANAAPVLAAQREQRGGNAAPRLRRVARPLLLRVSAAADQLPPQCLHRIAVQREGRTELLRVPACAGGMSAYGSVGLRYLNVARSTHAGAGQQAPSMQGISHPRRHMPKAWGLITCRDSTSVLSRAAVSRAPAEKCLKKRGTCSTSMASCKPRQGCVVSGLEQYAAAHMHAGH